MVYSHALEWEDLPCSWPSFPSAWSLMTASSLSAASPGTVAVHVGGVMEWERKPVGEGEKEQVIPGSYSVFTAFSRLQLVGGESHLPCA